MSLTDRILAFNDSLELDSSILPDGIWAMNPFKGEHARNITRITRAFYRKYYNDEEPRRFIVGINPGRLGAGLTGIPFTDTKRLRSVCGIDPGSIKSHEPSSVFVYEVIDAFGGPKIFYGSYYINSVCPLGFVKMNEGGKVNCNYYNNRDLQEAVEPYIIETLKKQIAMGLDASKVFCFGTTKNFKYLSGLNKREPLFGEIVSLEHPRYVMQYQSKRKREFVEKFVREFR